jgi:hypothetical protein
MDYRRKSGRASYGFRSPKELYTAASTWKVRSGRLDGPNEYVVGDLVRSIVLRLRAMPQRDRQELYGCPVLLIGVASAGGLTVPDDARLYCSLRALDDSNNPLKSGNLITSFASPSQGTANFDDVMLLGTSGDLDRVATLTLRVKRYNGVLSRQSLVGQVSIPMRKILAMAHADMPLCEVEYNLTGRESGASEPVGRIRLNFVLHYPPPDPRPIAVHVSVVEGRALIPRDTSGFSDPYVTVRPMIRRDAPACDETGRTAEYRNSTQMQTLNPVWATRDCIVFVDEDASAEHAARLRAEDGGLFPWDALGDDVNVDSSSSSDSAPTPAPYARVKCRNFGDVQGLHFSVMDWDAITADDDMGECFVSFSSLFGDEDAVIGCHSLSVKKWVRLRPTKVLADSGLDLGHILLHITLAFEQSLLPPLWQESVDTATGECEA